MTENLFSARRPSDQLYRNIRDSPFLQGQRRHLDELWMRWKPYADDRFSKKIGNEFLSRYWEMSLGCELLRQGFQVVPRADRKAAGPDICIRCSRGRTWIEAVAPEPGDGADAVEGLGNRGGWGEPDRIVLRYRSVIRDKLIRWEGYLANGVVGSHEAYLIAFCGCKIETTWFGSDVPYAVQAVLPFGQPVTLVDRETQEIVDEGFQHRPVIRKKSGSPVDTTLFLEGSSAAISGILEGYANPSEVVRPRIILCRNPSAGNPIPRGWLKEGLEWSMSGSRILHRPPSGG